MTLAEGAAVVVPGLIVAVTSALFVSKLASNKGLGERVGKCESRLDHAEGYREGFKAGFAEGQRNHEPRS